MVTALTLLHISDLHFGELDAIRGGSGLNAATKGWWQLLPLFDGFLGHGHDSLVALEELHDELKDSAADLRVLATGDLTANGALPQFAIADRYLSHQLIDPATGVSCGLNLGGQHLQILGNHDRWPGAPNAAYGPLSGIVGENPHAAKLASSLPSVTVVPIAGSNANVMFVSIDSDADVGPNSSARVFARGSFSSQCRKALALLPAPDPKAPPCLRVLVIHHSPSCPDYVLGIDKASGDALRELIEKGRISVMLCGHRHNAEFVTTTHGAVELRCGTTTQRSKLPEHWRLAHAQEGIKLRKLEKNTALVHRVSRTSKHFIWEAQMRVLRRDHFEITETRLFNFRV